jgi:5-formyltetrahydrofolate cyclo-ligase
VEPSSDKSALRRRMRRCLRELPPEVARRAGRLAAQQLASRPELARARRVVAYAALPGELPGRALFETARTAGKPVLLPRARGAALEFAPCGGWEELVVGRYGVLEPPPEEPTGSLAAGDLVLVPGLAFDLEGNRLGRGKGYWDRTFATEAARGVLRVGVAFACQVLEHVPHGPGDEPVQVLLTEEGWRRTAGRST